MSLAGVLSPIWQIVPEALRKPRGLLAIAVVVLLVAGPARIVWEQRRYAEFRDWRPAVEQGRAYLRQGRPDLAFQTVSSAETTSPLRGRP